MIMKQIHRVQHHHQYQNMYGSILMEWHRTSTCEKYKTCTTESDSKIIRYMNIVISVPLGTTHVHTHKHDDKHVYLHIHITTHTLHHNVNVNGQTTNFKQQQQINRSKQQQQLHPITICITCPSMQCSTCTIVSIMNSKIYHRDHAAIACTCAHQCAACTHECLKQMECAHKLAYSRKKKKKIDRVLS